MLRHHIYMEQDQVRTHFNIFFPFLHLCRTYLPKPNCLLNDLIRNVQTKFALGHPWCNDVSEKMKNK